MIVYKPVDAREEFPMFPQLAQLTDFMLILMNLIIICTGGGRYMLWK
jgi:hypothetical protein